MLLLRQAFLPPALPLLLSRPGGWNEAPVIYFLIILKRLICIKEGMLFDGPED